MVEGTVGRTLFDAGDEASDSALLAVARLAMGAEPAPMSAGDWELTFRVAIRQRCAALAWLRSSAVIRAAAPRETSSLWRAAAIAAAEGARYRAEQLERLLATLSQSDVAATVVKGLPLAVSLYGDASVRPTSDTDVYVAAASRASAHGALVSAGWAHLYGRGIGEGLYRRDDPRGPHFLEVHSSLLDDNILAHFEPLVPEWRAVEVEGRVLRAHGGASVPVFLAAHLAKHPRVPVLWWIDFATAWRLADPPQRAAVSEIARRHRLTSFLRWAVEGAGDMEDIGSPDESVSRRGLARLRARHDGPAVLRVAQLTENMADRARTLISWALPAAQLGDPVTLAHRTLERGMNWGRRRMRRKMVVSDAE